MTPAETVKAVFDVANAVLATENLSVEVSTFERLRGTVAVVLDVYRRSPNGWINARVTPDLAVALERGLNLTGIESRVDTFEGSMIVVRAWKVVATFTVSQQVTL